MTLLDKFNQIEWEDMSTSLHGDVRLRAYVHHDGESGELRAYDPGFWTVLIPGADSVKGCELSLEEAKYRSFLVWYTLTRVITSDWLSTEL